MLVDREIIRAQREASPESRARKLASAIYPATLKPFARSFFNRGGILEKRLQQSIIQEQPVQMIAFWGIGGKQEPDKYDTGLLIVYETLLNAIGQQYSPAADIMLILANAHGRFNGYQNFNGYHEAISREANQRGIASISLDELYREWNIHLPNVEVPVDKQSNEWIEFSQSRRFDQLVESAAKHNRAGINPEDAAFYYWIIRRQEREPLSRSFPHGILCVNGSEDLGRETLPLDMPHMYMTVGPVWFQHD